MSGRALQSHPAHNQNSTRLTNPGAVLLRRSHIGHPASQRGAPVPSAASPPTQDHASSPVPNQQNTREVYDVYAAQQPLEEGEEKHIISVFVADESGIINRVAGVFARRGANIESLAVGLNIDKALFTIEVTGTAQTVANLVKQLAKLLKVRYVEDVTSARRVERELLLLKVQAPPGQQRTEILQLADIFRARVVDCGDASLTLCATGDAGRTHALQRAVSKYGIVELARTGKICLKRGEELLEMGGWGEGQAPPGSGRTPDGSAGSAAEPRAEPERQQQAPPRRAEGNDVYVDSDDGQAGVWEVGNVLEACYNNTMPDFEPQTLSITVADVPGVLNHVTAVFARRGYNVQSLAVGPSEAPGCSRIVMVVPGGPAGTENIQRQLLKLIYVQKVEDLSSKPTVAREIMLVKVRCTAGQRAELTNVAHIFHGGVCDVGLKTITLEFTGKEDKMAAVQRLLVPYGILEIARTGRVALARDLGINTRFLGRMKSGVPAFPVY